MIVSKKFNFSLGEPVLGHTILIGRTSEGMTSRERFDGTSVTNVFPPVKLSPAKDAFMRVSDAEFDNILDDSCNTKPPAGGKAL